MPDDMTLADYLAMGEETRKAERLNALQVLTEFQRHLSLLHYADAIDTLRRAFPDAAQLCIEVEVQRDRTVGVTIHEVCAVDGDTGLLRQLWVNDPDDDPYLLWDADEVGVIDRRLVEIILAQAYQASDDVFGRSAGGSVYGERYSLGLPS